MDILRQSLGHGRVFNVSVGRLTSSSPKSVGRYLTENKMTPEKNTYAIRWLATLIDVGDNSGDCYVELPLELLERLNWQIGDTLNVEFFEGQLVVNKLESLNLHVPR